MGFIGCYVYALVVASCLRRFGYAAVLGVVATGMGWYLLCLWWFACWLWFWFVVVGVLGLWFLVVWFWCYCLFV